MKINSIDAVLKAFFTAPTVKKETFKRKAVKAARRKIRSADKLLNYATGYAIIDWIAKHPEETPVKYRPFKVLTTYKTARDLFIDEIKIKCEALSLTVKTLTPSDYGCDTILSMRDKIDIIVNTTFVDRVTGRMGKADLLVKSTVLAKFSSVKYTDTRGSSYAKSWHYVPVCFCTSEPSGSGSSAHAHCEAHLNISIVLDVLLKYQECSPLVGVIFKNKTWSTYRPANHAIISNGIRWLDSLDSFDAKDADVSAPGACAQISSNSPWSAAVKYCSFTQEHISMICTEDSGELSWRSIEEYDGCETDWLTNYYSDTGKNMDIFRNQFSNPVKLLSVDTLDDKIFQATILDTATGEATYYVAETPELNFQVPPLTWSWGASKSGETSDMLEFLKSNDIKFPFTCSYDLDFICFRALDEKIQEKIPVINFNLTEVAREYYYGTDKSAKPQLAKLMKQASARVPAIMHQLIKMSHN